MGPNSGGGRRNRDNNNPSNCARNRFSKWKPPTKDIKEKFSKQQEHRAAEQYKEEVNAASSSKGLLETKTNGNVAGKRSVSVASVPTSTQPPGELLTFSPAIVTQLMALFENTSSASTVTGDEAPLQQLSDSKACSNDAQITKKSEKSNRGKTTVFDTTVPPLETLIHDLSDTKKISIVNKSPDVSGGKDALERRKVRSLLGQCGFEMQEVTRLLSRLQEVPAQYNELEVQLAMLMELSEHPILCGLTKVSNSNQAADLSGNADLLSELDILSSIYMEHVTYRSATLLGKLACVIDVKVAIEDEQIVQLDAKGEPVLRVRMFVSDVASYPSNSSPLYGWILPHNPSGTVPGDSGSSPFLPADVARQLSVAAMAHIRGYQLQFEAPAAFEFIQHVRDSLADALPSLPPPSQGASKSNNAGVDTMSERMDKTAKQHGGGSQHSSVEENDSAPPPPAQTELNEGPPPMPPKPVTNFMSGMEYRTALSAAFSMGLVGQAARDRAHAELEFVLPKSTLEALKLEEAYHEETLNRACSIEDLSTRTLIESTRLLVDELQINKAKAKALLASAKQELAFQRDYFARSEERMRTKLVAVAAALYRDRLQRKDGKKKESLKRKAPGLTLRDAFARRRAREQEAITAQTETEEEIRLRDSKQGQNKPAGAAISRPAVSIQDESSEEEDEEVAEEEEPLDPAQIQAALLAAQEKQRLLDIESKQLQKKFAEKRRLPKYQDRLRQRSSLPAYQMKDAVVDAIDKHSVVVISGDTGCGKTTQVPQFVLDALTERGKGAECNIIVTQPRRISAISVAERIAHERLEQVGQSTGYHIRLEVKKGPGTRLLLMTTGVLLRMLQMEGNLEGISHVFVDEVHERDINTDFLLIILKKLLTFRPDLKIILMSATVNADLFLNYFRGGSGIGKRSSKKSASVGISSCCMLTIPGRTFPVSNYYLEDAFQVTNFEFSPTSPCIAAPKKPRGGMGKTPSAAVLAEEKRLKRIYMETLRRSRKYSEKTVSALEAVDESIVNCDLILKLVLHIIATSTMPAAAVESEPAGAILIFVSGISQIQDVIEALKASPELSGRKHPSHHHSQQQHTGGDVRIFPLHSSLSSHEQNAVFQKMAPGCRKIVVSTNIAETSVTIEDVVYVIDTCRVKENSYDEASQMNVLEEMWISKANARQRRGRAGRVRSGVCYHLVSQFTMDRLADYTVPEMLKMSLEDMILQILALDLGDPYKFLRGAISPPDDVAITNGLLFLESLSAIIVNNLDTSQNIAGKDVNFDLASEITPLGYHLAALPINPRIGKLILYGVLLRCIDPILTIAAVESVRSVFNSPFGEKELADEAKLRFLDGNSDLLTSANAVATWKSQYGATAGGGRRNGGGDRMSEGEYCRRNFLNMHSLRQVDQMRQQFLRLLQDIGFMPGSVSLNNIGQCEENTHGTHTGLLKSAICAGLSPNILKVADMAGKNSGKKLAEVSLQSRALGAMKVHPSSVMSEAKYLDSSYVVYLEAMRTSQVYVRDVTTIPQLVLAMFSGRSKTNPYNGAVVVDGWLRFRAPTLKACQAIARVRDAMDDAFMQKVLDPSSQTSEQWKGVLRCLEKAVSAN